jgi:hypothetical protein
MPGALQTFLTRGQRDRPGRGAREFFVAAAAFGGVAICRIVDTRCRGTIDQATVERPEAGTMRAVAQVRKLVQERADDGSEAPPAGSSTVGGTADGDGRHGVVRFPATAAIRASETDTRCERELQGHAFTHQDGLNPFPKSVQERRLSGFGRRALQQGKRIRPSRPLSGAWVDRSRAPRRQES